MLKNTNTVALALINATEASAEAYTRRAERLYTPEQLSEAYAAMRNGTHQYYPAAGALLGAADAAWARYSRLCAIHAKHQRDLRVGQLHLAI
jgi:hypothetical protein